MSFVAIVAAAALAAPVARIETGSLQGTTVDGVTAFKGVPYAAAPVGDPRWRGPQPAARWTGARDASAMGSDCVQGRMPGSPGARAAVGELPVRQHLASG